MRTASFWYGENGWEVAVIDENEEALFDVGKERVLLRAVEPVHLVEEEDRALAVLTEAAAGPGRDLPDLFHAGAHGGARVLGPCRPS